MNFAVIDLGTNTFNLLIAEQKDKMFKTKFVTKEFVKLGEGGINQQTIQPLAFDRGINTLMDYKLLADQYNCSEVVAVATSAIRNAENGEEFVKRAKQLTNINIETIDGEKEAEFIHRGTCCALKLGESMSMIMDVGGGSTEFIICDQKKVHWKKSVEVGVTRLFELFHHEDPIAIENINNIHEHLKELLDEVILQAKKYNVTTLVGSSGAFTSFASIIVNHLKKSTALGRKTNYQFSLEDYFFVHQHLIRTTLNERLKIKGLIKERAPMIVVGTILVDFVIKQVGITNFMLSRFSLKEGVAKALIDNELKF